MAETQQEHRQRRSRELNKLRKAELCALYRRMGGLGGIHPPEKWRKDEVLSSIIEMEWSRLPEDQKAPDPPQFSPPCDTCGKGENFHPYGHDHHYVYTFDPDKPWVPDGPEAEGQRTAPTSTATPPESITPPGDYGVIDSPGGPLL